MLLFGDFSPQALIATLLAVLIGMTVHEFAHNYGAFIMGDTTPERRARLTLNPMVHINPLGFLMFALIGFGILGSAPIPPAHRLRNPRWGFLVTVAAGPLSNLLLAIIFAIPIRLFGPQMGQFLFTLFFYLVFWNTLLFFFNLLPVFPIDGWHIVYALLPPDLAYTWQRYAQTTNYILLGLILLSFLRIPGLNILSTVVYQPAFSLTRFLLG